jgi:hypothetical protein
MRTICFPTALFGRAVHTHTAAPPSRALRHRNVSDQCAGAAFLIS